MPSKKRKYNARFPAGRIKKIMQTDEDVGKVAQAVPIIIWQTPRTLELFVESLLSKAMHVTLMRNAKTLSPSHVKQCILAESRFDFLRDLVKNVPDVSAAEEKEMMSAESSPNSSRCSDANAPPRKIAREDSNSSSSCDVRVQPPAPIIAPHLKRALSDEPEVPIKTPKIETITSPIICNDTAIDLSKKTTEDRPIRTANFYHETLPDEVPHKSVITVNPTYASPQPSTSYTNVTPIEPVHRIQTPVPKPFDIRLVTPRTPVTPVTPITPILNIDFTKSLANPEFKVLDTTAANIMGMPKNDKVKVQRQNSKHKEVKKVELKPLPPPIPVDIDHLNSGNLQIDEDYDT